MTRYRHSKGFGVHSPFAFRFITEVLGERCLYYDFDRLPSAHQRIVYRIAARLAPATYGVAGDADGLPVRMACPNSEQRVGAVDLLLAAHGASVSDLMPTIDAGGVVVIDGKERSLVDAAKSYLDTKCHGMTFDNSKDLCILVAYPHLPRQDFSTRI
ncbi:MAG: hypothetical protein K2K05_06660 [Muribaculaceae bacterium]|nr:hypothetical protein [Muribaculaceae bacterium]MDE6693051.1 hypothetical protein [Muribaculaceae bacterium]